LKQTYQEYEESTFYYLVETCYPHPIATIFRAMRTCDDLLGKFNACCFLFETVIRYCTLILLSGYLSSEEQRNPKADVFIWQFFEERNTPRSWMEIFKDMLLVYLYSGKYPVVPKLLTLYYDKKGNVNNIGRKLEKALFIRDQFGAMGCDSIKLASKHYLELEEILMILLTRLEFLCDYPLVRPQRIEQYEGKVFFEAVKFMGCEINPRGQESVSQHVMEDSFHLLLPEHNQLIELYPLLIYENCFCNDAHVFLFDYISGEQINYIFYSVEHAIGLKHTRQIDDLFSKGGRLKKKLLAKIDPLPKPSSDRKILKNYRLLNLIGTGGMGQIFKALQYDRGVMRAVKMLPSFLSTDKKWIKALEKEATKAAKVKHDNVVKMTAIGIFPGETFIVNEFIEHETLRTYLNKKKKFSQEEVLRIASQICKGLIEIHNEGIVHRNLKPENILIHKNEDIKISDFGIMKAFDAETDFLSGFPVKTAFYFAPEHFGTEKEINFYSDIYSLGVILFEMLTGEMPYDFPSKTIAGIGGTILFAPVRSLRELCPEISEDMENLILNCLERDCSRRYQDGEEFLDQLELLMFHRGLLKGKELKEYENRRKTEDKLREFLISIYLEDMTDGERREIISNIIKSFKMSTRKILEIETDISNRVASGEITKETRITVTIKDEKKVIEIPPSIISPVDGTEMILIPEGEFAMGTVEGDTMAREFEKPVHNVFVEAFYMDKYPVTNRQYLLFMEESGYKPQAVQGSASWWDKYFEDGKENHPVVGISWKDADEYCRWAGKRLPTEAEWEKTARGPSGFLFPWGNEWDKDKCNNIHTSREKIEAKLKGERGKDFWYTSTAHSALSLNMTRSMGTLPVWIFPEGASPYGVMDMAGNIWEWCLDWYLDIYYSEVIEQNPQGPEDGEFKVLRGGSWFNSGQAYYFRNTFRSWQTPDSANYYWGFRGSLPVESYKAMMSSKK